MVKVKRQGTTYCCDECAIVFTVFGNMQDRKTPYCPNCGDHIYVQLHQTKGTSKNTKARWTAEELELIDDCIEGKIFVYQVAILTGRTRDAVCQRKVKRVKELQNG